MALAAIIITVFFFCYSLLFIWAQLDEYLKLSQKEMFKHWCIRFLFIHRGRYWKNDLQFKNSILSLPSHEDLYTISKAVLFAEILNFLCMMITLILSIIGFISDNFIISILAIVFALIYAVSIFVFSLLINKKLDEKTRSVWNNKYERLVKLGPQNELSFKSVGEALKDNKYFGFEVYEISFIVKKYEDKSEKLQLIDLVHQRILCVSSNLLNIFQEVSINGRSLYNLWIYLKVSDFKSNL